jgi:hypothetical protein
VRSVAFVPPTARVESEHGVSEFVPPEARWYGCTGTFLRSGGFGPGLISYAEERGYPPAPIGWLDLRVERGRVVSLEKVIV